MDRIAWVHRAVDLIESDFNRSADTHLIKVAVPSCPDIDLYLKDESTHPTGSLKHRLARSLFHYHLCNGSIGPRTSSVDQVPEGRHELRFEFEPTGRPDFSAGKGAPGRFQLYVDGSLAGVAEVPHTTPMIYELEGLSCGYDALAPVLPDVYEGPFAFTGTIHHVTVDISGDLLEDDESTMRRLMAQQ